MSVRPDEVERLRARIQTAQATGALVTVPPDLLAALLDDRDSARAAYVRLDYNVQETLARALGMEKDPDYGYPTGDHTAETLAEVVADYCATLRGA